MKEEQGQESELSHESSHRKNKIHRKIGSNLILLQKVELLLKQLAFESNFSISLDENDLHPDSVKDQIKRQIDDVSKKTMGSVGGHFINSILLGPSIPDALMPSQGFLKFRNAIAFSNEDREDLLQQIKEVVGQRNKLVHQLLTVYGKCLYSSGEVDLFLDEQLAKAQSLFERLKELCEHTIQTRKEAAVFITDFPQPLLPDFFRHPPAQDLVASLWHYSHVLNKTDSMSWTSLSKAATYIQFSNAQSKSKCQEIYKNKSLKKILEKTGCFDLKVQSTKNGGTEIAYRLKPEFSIERDLEDGCLYFCMIIIVHGKDCLYKTALDTTL